jgi:L-ribulose-5-phosphate 4-epimerase
MLKQLKHAVFEAHRALMAQRLVFGTWGNASGIDRTRNLVAIKPSGVAYDAMKASDMVVVDLEGTVVDGDLRPSSDTATHLVLYRAFPDVGGIAHTHSHFATCWAQACRPIPCLGTTHADYFHGDVPLTAPLGPEDMAQYEQRTGEAIVARFDGVSPLHFPGVLVANHGPFAWGATVAAAVESAAVLEELARMAYHTLQLAPAQPAVQRHVLDKHFLRKHGENAYYGQTGQ